MHATLSPKSSFFPVTTAAAAGALALAGVVAIQAADHGIARGLEPVTGFDPERYLGRWFEISRLDHRFERGLENVTAEYTLMLDGTLTVQNRGYDPVKGRWRHARGQAKFAGRPDVGALKVSFFGPFFAAYNVIELDDDYKYAMVTGPSRRFLWILSRDAHPDNTVITELKRQANAWGFDTKRLVDVPQA